MRYVTFSLKDDPGLPRWGAMVGDTVLDLQLAQEWARLEHDLQAEPLPESLLELIYAGADRWPLAQRIVDLVQGEDPTRLHADGEHPLGWSLNQVQLQAPLPRPASLRDFYAFEGHVARSNANRGREVPPAWYEIPVFYYSNPAATYGHDHTLPYPSYSQALDYELEVACVIGSVSRDVKAEQAEAVIFGYMIFNDWSARDEQRREMSVGLGPAKGKDFASSFGPWLVTSDELAGRASGRPGVYDLQMIARVNQEQRSQGNLADIHYSFGEMIARASADVYLMPGDVIGSGTVATGCLLELTQGKGPWLQPGDVVEMEVDCLGVLRNTIGD
jgi:fumarylacetoacetate (FAA) hydrolase